MANWKNLERKTAKMLNGKRNSRGMDFSLSIAVVIRLSDFQDLFGEIKGL